jgi:hypothetical protein
VANNTLDGRGVAYYGVAFSGTNGSGSISNNIISSVTQGSVRVIDGARADIQSNLVYSAPAPALSTGAQGTLLGRDPLFANGAAADYGLQAGSPAIDAGVTLSGLITDLRGTARPSGGGVDIGAVERPVQGASSETVTAPTVPDATPVVAAQDARLAYSAQAVCRDAVPTLEVNTRVTADRSLAIAVRTSGYGDSGGSQYVTPGQPLAIALPAGAGDVAESSVSITTYRDGSWKEYRLTVQPISC